MTDEVTPRQVEAFQRFLALLPHGGDKTSVILKAHLLVEGQVRQIVDERVKDLPALEVGRFTCDQLIRLAAAFRSEHKALWQRRFGSCTLFRDV
jgi:hypothetical protein